MILIERIQGRLLHHRGIGAGCGSMSRSLSNDTDPDPLGAEGSAGSRAEVYRGDMSRQWGMCSARKDSQRLG